MKTSICTIARNEEKYIKEWVDYYKKLGFDLIFIFDNNESDKPLIVNEENVYVIPFHRLKMVMNFQTIMCFLSLQLCEANNVDWMAITDVDEFIVLKNHSNIKEYIQSIIDKDNTIDNIRLTLVIYDDNDIIEEPNTPIIETYTRISENQKTIYNYNYKSISKISNNYKLNFKSRLSWHCPENCNNIYKEDINNACINHYYLKCLESYLKHKIPNCKLFYDKKVFASKYIFKPKEYFCMYNKWNDDKEKFLNNYNLNNI